MADFTDPSTATSNAFNMAVAQGQLFNDTLRKNMAFNALAKVYGPIAGDPDTATKLQAYSHAQQMDPLLVQNQQLTNTGLAQTNDFNAANNPLRIKQNQQQVEQNQQTIDSNAMSAQATKALQLHGVLSAATASLGTKLQGVTDPNQRGALFDQEIQNIAPLVGQDPRVLAAQLRAERDRVVQGGADAIPQIQSDLDNLVMGALSPLDRQKLANAAATGDLTNAKIAQVGVQGDLTKAKIDQTKAATDATRAKTDATAAKGSGALTQEQASAMGTVVTSMEQTRASLEDAKKYIAQFSPYPALRAARALVWGTPEYNFVKAMDQVGHSNAINDLRSQRTLGLSLGRTTNAEFLAAAQALANMDIGQPTTTLLRNVDALDGMYVDKLSDAQRQIDEYKARAGAGGSAAAPAGGATATPPDIQTLLDKYK